MDITGIQVVSGILFLNFVSFGASIERTWKYDRDITNPKNWLHGRPQRDCNGLVLTSNSEVFLQGTLDVIGITFAGDSDLYLLDDSQILFNNNSKDIMNCVHIQTTKPESNWCDPDSWSSKSLDDNSAVPHMERIPCDYDDVVFPKGLMSNRCFFDTDSIRIKSFKFGDWRIRRGLVRFFEKWAQVVFVNGLNSLRLSEAECTDPTGCVCSNDRYYNEVCKYYDVVMLDCKQPIQPVGFCTPMCGAHILFVPKSTFDSQILKKSLADYTTDTYFSKVKNGTTEVIQVIFAEKEFSGTSLDEAQDFYSKLLEDNTLAATKVELYTAKLKISVGKYVWETLSMVFGSLFLVILVFGLIFYANSPQFAALNLRGRYTFSLNRLSEYKNNLYARFDNSENAGLIFERSPPSDSSSATMEQSFDNPLYGKVTASTSYSSVLEADMKTSTSDIAHENPLYELSEKKAVETMSTNENVSQKEEETNEDVDDGTKLVDL